MCVTPLFSLNNQTEDMKMKNFKFTYKPKSLADMVIPDPNNEIMPLLKKISCGQLNQNLILFGTNGTGKTTLAKVLTSEFYKAYGEPDTTHYVPMAYQRDDSNYGPNKIAYQWSSSDVSWHILDEVDKCSHKHVYDVLHHTLDNEHGHKYLLTANKLGNIPNGILSRARPIPIDCPTPVEFLPRAKLILQQERVVASDEKILAVLSAAERDLRRYYDALELL